MNTYIFANAKRNSYEETIPISTTFFLLNTPYFIYAQLKGEQLADSLKQSLLTAKEDTVKVLYRLGRIFAPNDSAQASLYANETLRLSQKLKW